MIFVKYESRKERIQIHVMLRMRLTDSILVRTSVNQAVCRIEEANNNCSLLSEYKPSLKIPLWLAADAAEKLVRLSKD